MLSPFLYFNLFLFVIIFERHGCGENMNFFCSRPCISNMYFLLCFLVYWNLNYQFWETSIFNQSELEKIAPEIDLENHKNDPSDLDPDESLMDLHFTLNNTADSIAIESSDEEVEPYENIKAVLQDSTMEEDENQKDINTRFSCLKGLYWKTSILPFCWTILSMTRLLILLLWKPTDSQI